MKNTKVVQGWYCTRCNHKIPEAQCSTLRVLYTGVCSKCSNEYDGAMIIRLFPGESVAKVEKYENNEHFGAILQAVPA